ncbi:MAG: anti-sigma factor antagonist [Solirubrobacteraceae bacterium]|jgi:anti-anti-sigma factor|nr:anti-sigma factor antagonist [Solirubrobacteraceae bacterium]
MQGDRHDRDVRITDDVTEQHEPSPAEQVIELGVLTLRSRRKGGAHTIALSGELDLATADDVQRELERVEATDAASIVLDLSDLMFMDSTGVRLLMTASARSRGDANRLTLLRGGPAVQRVLELSGVDALLPFAD